MIDWKFIEEMEGFSVTGYVPDSVNSKSGVTIASGFDLGQRDLRDIPEQFQAQFKPYLGLKGVEAVEYLNKHPLRITADEARTLNEFAHKEVLDRLIAAYGPKLWATLNDKQQTVIASVAFQYGDLEKRTPNFWRQIKIQCWLSAYTNLCDFGDRYKTRRQREATLLLQSVQR